MVFPTQQASATGLHDQNATVTGQGPRGPFSIDYQNLVQLYPVKHFEKAILRQCLLSSSKPATSSLIFEQQLCKASGLLCALLAAVGCGGSRGGVLAVSVHAHCLSLVLEVHMQA